MKRGFITLLFLVVAIYAAYRYGIIQGKKNTQSPAAQTTTSAQIPVPVPAPVSDPAPAPAPAPADSPTTSAGDGQYSTHTVQAGETLFTVGLKYNLMWTSIAQLNNMTENQALVVGQVIKIPLNSTGQKINEEILSVSSDDSKLAQEQFKNGQNKWRSDPIAVVRQTAPIDYHLKNDDTYALVSLDKQNGQAKVGVTHDGQIIDFDLTQPQEKGDNGVWYITKITKTSAKP